MWHASHHSLPIVPKRSCGQPSPMRMRGKNSLFSQEGAAAHTLGWGDSECPHRGVKDSWKEHSPPSEGQSDRPHTLALNLTSGMLAMAVSLHSRKRLPLDTFSREEVTWVSFCADEGKYKSQRWHAHIPTFERLRQEVMEAETGRKCM